MRRLFREFVIFGLLGMFLTTAGTFAYKVRKAKDFRTYSAADIDDPYAAYGGHIDYDALAKKHGAILPCVNLPIGSILRGDCILSGQTIHNFRPEMCIGTIRDNGDCEVEISPTPSIAKNIDGTTTAIQICPYGLAINTAGECPAWDTFDYVPAEQKLREYRERKSARVPKITEHKSHKIPWSEIALTSGFIGLTFGSLGGVGLWILYRLVYFAVKG